MIRRIKSAIFIYLLLSVGGVFLIYQNAFRTELSFDRDRGSVRLSEAISRIRGQLHLFGALANIIAGDPDVIARFTNKTDEELTTYLSFLSLTYGVHNVDYVDASGRIIASSQRARVGQTVGSKLISAAMNGRLAHENLLENGTRLVRYARNIVGKSAAVVLSADLQTLEFEWPISPEPILFLTADQLIFSANRSSLLLHSTTPHTEYASLLLTEKSNISGMQIWSFGASPSTEVQTLSRFIPQLNLTAKILLDTAGARTSARLRAMLAATVFLTFGLVSIVLSQQRRRIVLDAEHSATLETRVAKRTEQLRSAQDELLEATKLAALGRLSAGISHEVNQPLAAILNFSENGRRFLERDTPDKAASNFAAISDQVRRITRIITNLRAFARQEILPTDKIDFSEVVKEAAEVMRADLTDADIELKLERPTHPVYVLAGRVRLQQVILNLISNAVDAMGQSHTRLISLNLSQASGMATLVVKDTGPGITDPERVFEPFYTTKELGSSKGLGMGLALSFGIIARFGGQLSCRNLGSGAEFKISLPRQETIDV